LLPEAYIGDVNMRLAMYKKLANCNDMDEIDNLQIEMIDRFGLLPQPAKNLVQQTVIKLTAASLGISKIEVNDQGGTIEFEQDAKLDPGALIQLIQKKPAQFRFDGPTKIRFMCKTPANIERLDYTLNVIDLIGKSCYA
jgi:transcription-repair coupling factor (superfamily II helicase)